MREYFLPMIIGGMLLSVVSLNAQDALPGTIEPKSATEPFAVRPLKELMADAMENAPLLKVQDLNVENIYHKIKLLEKEWSQYFNLIGSVQVGNITFLDDLESNNGDEVRTVTRENYFYGLGFQIRIPLSDFITRNDRRAILQNQMEQEKLVREDRTLKLRELVLRQYQDLQLAVEILKVRTKEFDFHTLTADMAEKKFQDGTLALQEYTTAVS
ncbi:MAG: TolC family protein [Bacteroidota bacterium]